MKRVMTLLLLLLILPLCAGAERCETIVDCLHYGRDNQGKLVVTGGEAYVNEREEFTVIIHTELDGEPVERVWPTGIGHFGNLAYEIQFVGDGDRLPTLDMQDFANGEAIVEIPAGIQEIDLKGRDSFLMNTWGFELNPDNPVYGTKDGCFFRKADGTLLAILPTEGSYNWWEAITLPPEIKRIAAGAFDAVDVNTLYIPEGVTEVEPGAGRGLRVESLYLPASLRDVPDDLLAGTVSSVTIKAGNPVLENRDGLILNRQTGMLLYVPQNYAGDLTAVKGITGIGPTAFQENDELQTLTIPEGVTTLCDGALAKCYDLKTLHLPSTLVSIGEMALPTQRTTQMESVNTITVAEGNSRYVVERNLLLDNKTKSVLYVFDASRSAAIIPPGTERLDRYMMSFRTAERLSLPLSVTEIPDWTFSECVALTELSLPPTLRHIGAYAFAHCIRLQALYLPVSLETIGARAFYDCSSLKEIHFPDSIKAIDMTAFNCTNDAVAYAKKGTVGYQYALARGMLWAEPGDEPIRLKMAAPEVGIVRRTQVQESVPLRSLPDERAEPVGECGIGETVFLTGETGDWWHITYDLQTGYLPKATVEPMNRHTSLKPLSSIDTYFWFFKWPDTYDYPSYGASGKDMYDTERMDVLYPVGAWLLCYGGSDEGYVYYPIYNDVPDFEDDGSGKRYGVVVNEFSYERLNLRDLPKRTARSLGRYYTGTQVEILEEIEKPGEVCPEIWYEVQVDGKQGYMLADFVCEMTRQPQE